jgi:hypothetical protein
MLWSVCCGSRCLDGSPVTRMSTTPNACAMIRRCVGSSTAKRLRAARPRRVRWVASRHSGLRRPGTSLLLPTYPAKWIELVQPNAAARYRDSSVSSTHGEQENSVWNGHYALTCYHPLYSTSSVIGMLGSAPRQCSQRRRLRGSPQARRCALPGQGLTPLFAR